MKASPPAHPPTDRKWMVMLEIESHLKPTELAIMVNMFPGVVDARVADSRKLDSPTPQAAHPQDDIDEILVLFSKRLAIVQGEYNAHQRLSLTQRHAEQAQDEARAALLAYVDRQRVAARIDELEGIIEAQVRWVTRQHIRDRLKALRDGEAKP